MELLSNKYTKITVIDQKTGEELAVITDQEIITANENIVVKLTPDYN